MHEQLGHPRKAIIPLTDNENCNLVVNVLYDEDEDGSGDNICDIFVRVLPMYSSSLIVVSYQSFSDESLGR